MDAEPHGGPVGARVRVGGDRGQEVLTDEAFYVMCQLRLPSSNASFAAADLISSLISPQANADYHLASCCRHNTSDRMTEEGTRLRTFDDLAVGTRSQRQELVDNGLYYRASDGCVQCAFCNGIAKLLICKEGNLLPERNVHYDDCVFAQTAEHVKEVMAFMDRPEVGIILEMGYCQRRMMKLISRRVIAKEDCLSTRTLLETLQAETSTQAIQ